MHIEHYNSQATNTCRKMRLKLLEAHKSQTNMSESFPYSYLPAHIKDYPVTALPTQSRLKRTISRQPPSDYCHNDNQDSLQEIVRLSNFNRGTALLAFIHSLLIFP